MVRFLLVSLFFVTPLVCTPVCLPFCYPIGHCTPFPHPYLSVIGCYCWLCPLLPMYKPGPSSLCPWSPSVCREDKTTAALPYKGPSCLRHLESDQQRVSVVLFTVQLVGCPPPGDASGRLWHFNTYPCRNNYWLQQCCSNSQLQLPKEPWIRSKGL